MDDMFYGAIDMLVMIESFYGDRIISGKKCTEKTLRQKMNKILGMIGSIEDFTHLFCRVYCFEEYPCSEDIKIDFVIDLDTHIVYTPRY